MTQKERDELNRLEDTARSIMNMGNMRLTPYMIKRLKDLNKSGYPFPVIEQAFIKAQADIEWALAVMTFKDNTHMFNYCFAIVNNSINDVWANTDKEKMDNKLLKSTLKELSHKSNTNATYKTKEITDSFAERDKEWMK